MPRETTTTVLEILEGSRSFLLRDFLPLVGAVGLLLGALHLVGCAASQHPTVAAPLGRSASSEEMLRVLDQPGPVQFEVIVAADWAVERSGLINLDHPAAVAAGLEDGSEPIQIYTYGLVHPRFGTFLVDSGVSEEFEDPERNERVGFLVRQAMNTDALAVRKSTRAWLAAHGGALDGVFLTHIHIDHVMGLADVPAATPVYTGPGETVSEGFLNLFTQSTTDALLEPVGPLREWAFETDPSGRFAGVIDVFGDGSVWAVHVPGHSPGSTAFVVRTPDGAKLLVGDASHTAWGWRNGVEPGTFSANGPESAKSLAALRRLAAEHPDLEVHLGHQALD